MMLLHLNTCVRVTGYVHFHEIFSTGKYQGIGTVNLSTILCIESCLHHILPIIILYLQIIQWARMRGTCPDDDPTRPPRHRWGAQCSATLHLRGPMYDNCIENTNKTYSGTTWRETDTLWMGPTILGIRDVVFNPGDMFVRSTGLYKVLCHMDKNGPVAKTVRYWSFSQMRDNEWLKTNIMATRSCAQGLRERALFTSNFRNYEPSKNSGWQYKPNYQ